MRPRISASRSFASSLNGGGLLTDGKTTETNGYTIVLDGKPRFFPWVETYFWSRDQAPEYSAASGLMALEAWSQERLDKGDESRPFSAMSWARTGAAPLIS